MMSVLANKFASFSKNFVSAGLPINDWLLPYLIWDVITLETGF